MSSLLLLLLSLSFFSSTVNTFHYPRTLIYCLLPFLTGGLGRCAPCFSCFLTLACSNSSYQPVQATAVTIDLMDPI